jgi:hypothetical protein
MCLQQQKGDVNEKNRGFDDDQDCYDDDDNDDNINELQVYQ